MKKLFLMLLFAIPVFGQQANVNSPAARPAIDHYVVKIIHEDGDCQCAQVHVEAQDSSNNPISRQRFDIPDANIAGSSFVNFETARGTTRASETGGTLRRLNFRVLGYLVDTGYLSGVTLVP